MIGCSPMKGIGLIGLESQSRAVGRVGLLMAYGILFTAKKNRITDLKYIGRLHLRQAVSIAGEGLLPWTYIGVYLGFAQLVTREVTLPMTKILWIAVNGKILVEEKNIETEKNKALIF